MHIQDKIDAVLYVIDNVNYVGGAHIATINQIHELQKLGKKVAVFGTQPPSERIRQELAGVEFISTNDQREARIFQERFLACMVSFQYTFAEKALKCYMTFCSKVLRRTDPAQKLVKNKAAAIFDRYTTVCVMSEGSIFREAVAASACDRKIQWVHIDYAVWCSLTAHQIAITKNDGNLYREFDKIVFVSNKGRDGFIKKYPHLAGKTAVIRNFIAAPRIQELAAQKCEELTTLGKPHGGIKLVTVARLDQQKDFPRAIRAAKRLAEEGCRFSWDIVGDGVLKQEIAGLVERYQLNGYINLLGERRNPFPFVKNADMFALFSLYEGISTVVFEAMILGVPVIATRVAGIEEQITNGVNGLIVENAGDAIYQGLKYILDNPDIVAVYRNSLEEYHYDNDSIREQVKEIFC